MNRIKIIACSDPNELQEYCDEWIDEEHPNIISISTLPDNDVAENTLVILYDDGVFKI